MPFDETLNAAWQAEQLQQHRKILPTSVCASVLAGALVAGLMWGDLDHFRLMAWLVCLAGSVGLRVVVGLECRRALDGAGSLDTLAWRRRYRWSFVAHGLVWALAGLLLFPSLGKPQFDLLVFALVAIASGSLIATAFDLVAAALFAGPSLLPLVIHVVRHPGEGATGLSLILALSLTVACLSAARVNRMLRESVRLGLVQARQHQLTSLMLETTQQGYWFLDKEGLTTNVNPAMCALLGLQRCDIMGRLMSDFLDASGGPLLRSTPEAPLQEDAGESEWCVTLPSGTQRHCLQHGTLIRDDGGAVIGSVSVWIDITERKRSEKHLLESGERIHELAFFDSLTRLPNRVLMRDRLYQAFAAGSRSRALGALLFIDLDNFKVLNEFQGHVVGDQMLSQVAQRIAACLREGDTVARLGGDEFVVVLEGLGEDRQEAAGASEAVCEKILTSLRDPYDFSGVEHHATASIGVTLFLGHEESIDNLLKQAEIAMYRAKAGGRNAFCFYDPVMQATVMERAALEADLYKAIQGGQFVLYYQAQVDRDGKVKGCEALIRWSHPERGMVPPADFIPLAEEVGTILQIGQWVLETACCQLALWSSSPALKDVVVAVNVSARQLQQTDFVHQVIDALQRSGAQASRLKLELTEGLLVSNVDDTIRKMNALKLIGVGFSLDDFGTGYSSMAYLSRLPLDQLKIDRSFVMNIEMKDEAVAICSATISLAHSLRMKVVAEGVETDAQRYFLSTVHRCDLIQGYLTSRPLPVDQFEVFAKGR